MSVIEKKAFFVKLLPGPRNSSVNPQVIAAFDNEPKAREYQNNITSALAITNGTVSNGTEWKCEVEMIEIK